MGVQDAVNLEDYERLKDRLAELEAENRALRNDVLRYEAWLDDSQNEDEDESLSTAQFQLNLVIAKAPIIFWSMDRDGVFTESRGRGLQLIGLEEGSAIGQSVWEMYREYPEILKTIRRTLAGEEISETVYLDGTYFDTYYSPIVSPSGEDVIGVRGMSVVVSDREIARIAFWQTSEIMRDIFSSNAMGVLLLSGDGLTIVDANPALVGISEHTLEEIRGRTLSDLGLIIDQELVARIPAEISANGQLHPLETRIHTKNGSELDVSISADRLRIGDETFVLLLMEETTQRRRVLKHFEEQQSELNADLRKPYSNLKQFTGELQNLIRRRSPTESADEQGSSTVNPQIADDALTYFLKCVPDSVCTIDRSGTILYLNRTTLPTRVENIVGASAYDFVSPHNVEESRAVIKRVFETGEIMTQELQSPGKDGEIRHFSCRIGPMRRFGRVIAVIVVATDVTALHDAQDSVRRRQLEFERLAQLTSLGQMATMVAHEINNPLAAIANYAQGCIRRIQQLYDEPSETLAANFQTQAASLVEALEDVTEQANEASGAIRRLRRFLSSRGSVSHTVPTSQIIQEAVDWVTPIVRAKDVVLHLDVAESLPLIAADPLQIEQVLVHLILNGVDAVTENGQNTSTVDELPTVRLSVVLQDKSNVMFTISDNGPGLSETVLRNLFHPFFTTKQTGFGMGLTISQAIVEMFGGRLWWEEHPPSGAVFHFVLPISQGESTRA